MAQWVTTNLRPAPGRRQLRWTFDLDGIAEMYDSYEASSMWELLQQPPQGLSVDFVRAERSSFRWEGGVMDNLEALGHRVHLLRDAGHVVHQDNPGEHTVPRSSLQHWQCMYKPAAWRHCRVSCCWPPATHALDVWGRTNVSSGSIKVSSWPAAGCLNLSWWCCVLSCLQAACLTSWRQALVPWTCTLSAPRKAPAGAEAAGVVTQTDRTHVSANVLWHQLQAVLQRWLRLGSCSAAHLVAFLSWKAAVGLPACFV